MAEKDTIFSGKVQREGIFHFKDFYSFTYQWFVDERYKIIEKKYSEEITGDSKKVEIEWEAKKKISDYFRFLIEVRWIIVSMKDVEVQREGQKVKMNKGKPELKIKAILVKDYEHRWENRPVWKFLRGIYDKYIIRSRIEKYEEDIKEETERFIVQCKSFLALEGKKII